MLVRSFLNWSLRARSLFFLLLATAVVVTALSLRNVGKIEADLDLLSERCILSVDSRLHASGFSPVSELVLCRVDEIHLGAGVLDLRGRKRAVVSEVSLHLERSRLTSSVLIAGTDLAIGEWGAGPGRFDMQSLSPGGLGVDFLPAAGADAATGKLSLGDSCRITILGYDLKTDGRSVFRQPGGAHTITFHTLGGAGHFVDEEGGFSMRIKAADCPLEFDAHTRLNAVRFLDRNGQCGGVSGGTIRVGRAGLETEVPPNACIRTDGVEHELRYLAVTPESQGVHAAVSGTFRFLELNGLELVSRPTLLAALVGVFVLTAFGFLAHVGTRLLGAMGSAIAATSAEEMGLLSRSEGSKHLFISHSHKDKGYARRLAQDMREHGFLVWLDDDLRMGQWPEEIKTRIERCAALVVIVTPRSLESSWVNGELAHAAEHGRMIVPLLLIGSDLPLAAKAFQCTDVTSGNLPSEEFYGGLVQYAPRGRAVGEASKKARSHTSEAARSIELAGNTVFRCRSCGFPVSYDTMMGGAAALLFGLPSIGGVVVYYLAGWKVAVVFGTAALLLVVGVLRLAGELLREPSKCPDCRKALTRPLAMY